MIGSLIVFWKMGKLLKNELKQSTRKAGIREGA